MSDYEHMRTADIVAEALLDWKVHVIFRLPGDGINGFIEALRTRQDKIKFILVRHEESAAFMACAYAKYTGKLGACVATSGPGAIHLLNGLYDAKADNTPVIAITGTTYSDLINSKYQQDVNLLQPYSDIAVHNDMIRVPEQAEMAVDIACRSVLVQRGLNFPMRKYGSPPLIDLTDCKDIIIVDRNYLIDHISSIYRWAQSQEG